MKVFEAWRWASRFLLQEQRESKVAEILLCHHLHCNKTTLLTNLQEPLSSETWTKYKRDVYKHSQGIPVQHLTGEAAFYGRLFQVSADVLIPRPETEELVETVWQEVQQHRSSSHERLQILDVGTGSGVIAVTLALALEAVDVYAVDTSQAALRVARQNSERYDVDIELVKGDLCEPFINRQQTFDIVISNPPYIPAEAYRQLDDVVYDHEPALALYGGEDGFDIYRRLLRQLPAVLNHHGFMAFEVGIHQAEDVRRMIRHLYPTSQTAIHQDINGKQRIVTARLSA